MKINFIRTLFMQIKKGKTIILLFFILLSGAVGAQNQKIKLPTGAISIQRIFQEIEKQTNLSIDYNQSRLNVSKQLDIQSQENTLSSLLNEVLKNTGFEYRIDRGHIIIKQNESAQKSQSDKKKRISGVVKDENGEPVIGANVVVKGTTNGTMTDLDGGFTLDVPLNAILQISYVGYLEWEEPVKDKNNILVQLAGDTQNLQEVVVVGFGSQKKENLTGSVSMVNSKAFENRPVQNATQALQGMVPGLNIASSLGGVNAKPTINVRGKTTIGTGSTGDPLILIDGMEGDINTINPQDIESISILKDAAASSIYGSRAPFGVILVTTKTGSKGKMSINYNNSFRISQATVTPDLVDSYRYALVVNESAVNDNRSTSNYFKDEIIERILDFQQGKITTGLDPKTYNGNGMKYTANGDTNWYDEYFKKSAFAQEHSLSLNGGNEKVQVYASMNYLNQDGLLKPAEDNYKRYATNLRATGELFSFMNFTYSVKFNREDFKRPTEFGDDAMSSLVQAAPNYPATDDHGYYYEFDYRCPNLLGITEGGTYNNRNDNLYQQFSLQATPVKGWNINAEINYRLLYMKTHEDSQIFYNHDIDGNPYAQTYVKGNSYVNEYNQNANYLNPNVYTDYSFTLSNSHHFKIMAGFQAEQKWYTQVSAKRNGIIITGMDQIDVTNGTSRTGAIIPPGVSGNNNGWATVGFFGRLNYDYKNRYLAEVNLRYDGTSRFRKDKRWKLLPSFSVGWNIAREDFWEDYINICNELKLRGSYGVLGNQNTTNLYPTYVVQPIGTANGGWLIGNSKPNTASAPGIINSAMTWERIQTVNIGGDVAFFGNRLNASFDWFRRRTKDMVGPAPELPVILGTEVPKENNTELESRGWELSVKWQDRLSNGFGYNLSLILSDAKAKILKYPNPGHILNIPATGYGTLGGELTNYYSGQTLGEIWGYETIGIAKSQEEMDAHLATLPNGGQNALGKNFGAGDIMYADLDKDGKISTASGTLDKPGDLKVIGNTTPRYMFGLDMGANWKGFDLKVFFQGILKKDFATTDLNFMGMCGGIFGMLREQHMDYFRENQDNPLGQNLDAYYPRVIAGTSNPKNYRIQSRYVQNAAYVRLKNLQIGYTLPVSITQKFGASSLRFFISGENLLTFTQLSDIFDPEAVDLGSRKGATYPFQKVYSLGLNVNF